MTFSELNPKFLYFSPITTALADLAEQVDHAIIALNGRAPVGGNRFLERLNAIPAPGTLRIELWVNDLGDYTCTYGFLISSENGRIPYARGERTVVNIDPRSRAPQKWSNEFRMTHEEWRKDLPAYA